MSKLNPDVKARWVEALLSDKYTQTQGRLRDAKGMCCLGVLCDVLDPEGWGEVAFELDGARYHRGALAMPTPDVTLAAGVAQGSVWMNLEVDIDGISQTLDFHNDKGKTFAQIAKAIQEQL